MDLQTVLSVFGLILAVIGIIIPVILSDNRRCKHLVGLLERNYDHTTFTIVPDSAKEVPPVCKRAARILEDEIRWLLREYEQRTIVIGVVGGATTRKIVQYLLTKRPKLKGIDCKRLRFISLNMAGNHDYYQFSGNYLAVSLSEVFAGSSHSVVLPNWTATQENDYNQYVRETKLLFCSAGSRDGFLSEWLRRRNPPLELPPEAIGDFCLFPIDGAGNVLLSTPQLESAITNELAPQPHFQKLSEIKKVTRVECIVLPMTAQPRLFAFDSADKGALTQKGEITRGVLSSGIVNHCILNKSLAEDILGKPKKPG